MTFSNGSRGDVEKATINHICVFAGSNAGIRTGYAPQLMSWVGCSLKEKSVSCMAERALASWVSWPMPC
jgi:hypothetical protein